MQAGKMEFVLRKQPPGKLLPSAHAVDREFAVISALQRTLVPVPQAISLCNNTQVLGTRFYVMSFVDGRLFLDPALPGASAEQRHGVYAAMAGTLSTPSVLKK
jgi:aminoglycoside phosphotransferase (APT) family kinase protein